jgi:serine/threonine protein kinase
LILSISCLAEDPTDRISAKAALTHQFFSEHELLPTLKDMVLLPTNVLRLLNVFDDPKYKNEDDIKGTFYVQI